MFESESTGIACLQLECAVGQVEGNVRTAVGMAREAMTSGARLLVLPELCTSGYVLANRDEAYEVAETVPDGPSSVAFAELCVETGAYLVAGIAERAGSDVYNSAVLFGPEGYVGTYRKLHLWNRENIFFEPGDLGIPVFHTRIGRVALAICYDAWFPEVFRACASGGADVVAMPSNWVSGPADADGELPIGVTLAVAAATCNGFAVAVADRVGVERGERFLGSSAIVGANGRLLAPVAGSTEPESVHAKFDVSAVRAARSWSPYNHVLHDRRNEVYGAMPSPSGRR